MLDGGHRRVVARRERQREEPDARVQVERRGPPSRGTRSTTARTSGSSRKRFDWKKDRTWARSISPSTGASTCGSPWSHCSRRGWHSTPSPLRPRDLPPQRRERDRLVRPQRRRERRDERRPVRRLQQVERRAAPVQRAARRRARPRSASAASFIASDSCTQPRKGPTRCVPSSRKPSRSLPDTDAKWSDGAQPPAALGRAVHGDGSLERRARPRERLAQDGLLEPQLLRVGDLLVGAAAAIGAVRARRLAPAGRGLQHLAAARPRRSRRAAARPAPARGPRGRRAARTRTRPSTRPRPRPR